MTNNDIKKAAFDLLGAAALGLPISWPGIKFTPPGSGQWLEVSFFPNTPIDNGLRYADQSVPRGILQVTVMQRSGEGSFDLGRTADQVRSVYPKGQSLIGSIRVVRDPYEMAFETRDDRMGIAVSVVYSG